MFKVAHSLSIALGFVVACACCVCGLEKPDFASTQTRAESAAQEVENLHSADKTCSDAQKLSSSNRRGDTLNLFDFIPAPQMFAIQPESPELPSPECVENFSCDDAQAFVRPVLKCASNRIRAPSLA